MTTPFRTERRNFKAAGNFLRKCRGDEIRGQMTIRRDRRPRSGYGGAKTKCTRGSSWQRHIRALGDFVNGGEPRTPPGNPRGSPRPPPPHFTTPPPPPPQHPRMPP